MCVCVHVCVHTHTHAHTHRVYIAWDTSVEKTVEEHSKRSLSLVRIDLSIREDDIYIQL